MDTHTGYQKLLAGESSGRICNNPECPSEIEEIVPGYKPVWPVNIKPMRLLTGGAEVPRIPFECCPNCGKEMEEVGVDAVLPTELPYGALVMAPHIDNPERKKIKINCPCGSSIDIERRNLVAKCTGCERFFDRIGRDYGKWYWQWGVQRSLCKDCNGTGKYPNAYSKDGPCPSCGGTGN